MFIRVWAMRQLLPSSQTRKLEHCLTCSRATLRSIRLGKLAAFVTETEMGEAKAGKSRPKIQNSFRGNSKRVAKRKEQLAETSRDSIDVKVRLRIQKIEIANSNLR